MVLDLNTDFGTHGISATELTAVVNAWQSGAMSHDTMLDLFRRGEVLPDGRSNEEEAALIGREKPPAASLKAQVPDEHQAA